MDTTSRSSLGLTPVDSYLTGSWEALGSGAPALVALAQIASQSMVNTAAWTEFPNLDELSLSAEAKAILVLSITRGIIEIRGSNVAFEAPSRLLAVHIEIDSGLIYAFRDPRNPEMTVKYLDAFRQLCANGLVMHHLYREFTLTTFGYHIAKQVDRESIKEQLDLAKEISLHD